MGAVPSCLTVDAGVDADALLGCDILPIIRPKANRRRPIAFDYWRSRGRNRIERMYRYIKHQRRIATRYDKTALSFASFLNLAANRRLQSNFVRRT